MDDVRAIIEDQLHPGEHVVWVSVDGYGQAGQIGPDSARAAVKASVPWFAAALVALFVTVRFWSTSETVGLIACVVAVALFAGGMMHIRGNVFFNRAAHFQLVMHAPSFVSCVLTNQRVLLFNDPSERIVSLPRADLASPMPEFAEGTSAVLLTQASTRSRYLFVTDEFGPLVRALADDRPRGAAS